MILIFILIAVVVSVLVGVFVINRKSERKDENPILPSEVGSLSNGIVKTDIEPPTIPVEFKQIEPIDPLVLEKKFEIKDNKLLKIINATIPATAKITQQALNNQAVINSVSSQVDKIGKVYTATLSNGGELAKWKGKADVFQGVSRKGGSSISEYAELREAKLTDIKANPKSLVSVANVMQIASLVVGQYYMAEIDNKIGGIESKVSQIMDFLDNQLNAELKSEMMLIRTLSKFSVDIFAEKAELNRHLIQIDNSIQNLNRIVVQANNSLKKLLVFESMDYKLYLEKIEQIEKWQEIQKAALTTMIEATRLKVLLTSDTGLSDEYHTELLNSVIANTLPISEQLKQFHIKSEEKFGLNYDTKTRKNDQFLISIIKKERPAEETILKKIIEQKDLSYNYNVEDIIYAKNNDVNLIVENGKFFYVE